MELKLAHETICINEVVFDGALEQPIELDYLLPDYCKSIFKILKCRITPKITAARVQNGRLLVEGLAHIKILYISEDEHKICSIYQKQGFSKTVEIKDGAQGGCVTAFAKCDYVNCRAVNQHRLDVRGAVCIKVSVSVVKTLEVLSKASGMGVQVCPQNITALDKKLTAHKDFSVKEELELAYGKPGIAEILEHSCSAALTEYKLIANKIIIKADISLHLLYLADDAEQAPQIMDYTIPISQIIDMPGVNEDYRCTASIDVVDTEMSLNQSGDGECKSFEVTFDIHAVCEGNKNANTQLICDLYSTCHPVQNTISKIKVEQLADIITHGCICKSVLPLPQNELNCVYDITCDFSQESCRVIDDEITITGNLTACVLALDCDSMPIVLERSSPCEIKIPVSTACGGVSFSPTVTVASISYHIISAQEIEVCAEVKVCGPLFETCCYELLSSVSMDETVKKERNTNAVLRLYFAQSGEKVWDIAKRFNTSMDAVMSENSLEAEKLSQKGMLLIPIVE